MVVELRAAQFKDEDQSRYQHLESEVRVITEVQIQSYNIKSTQNPLVRMLGFHTGGITHVRKKTIACVQNLYTSYTIQLNFDSEM